MRGGEKCFCVSLKLVLVVITLTSITVLAQTGGGYSLMNESVEGGSKPSDFALFLDDEKKLPSERSHTARIMAKPSPPSPSTPTAPTPAGGEPSTPTTAKDSSSLCNRDGLCTGREDCKTCSADCETRSVTCGDGICVEGENCINCPSDCNGNISAENVTSNETFCCGFADGYSPNGCSDSRCTTGTLKCFEEACEGKPNPSARTSNVIKNGPDVVIVLYLTVISFLSFV